MQSAIRRRTVRRITRWLAAGAVAATFVASAGHATLIASWDFDADNADDGSGSAVSYDLASVGTGVTFAGGELVLPGDDASPSYLEIAGPGGMPTWTVSLALRTDGVVDQGLYQGIFSNNTSSTASYSWQLESHAGRYQWRNATGTFDVGAPSGVGSWDHIVIRKFGGNDGDIWLNGVQVLSSIGGNPGGLQNFRLGTNRNTNRLWAGALDDVLVFDSLEDPAALYAASSVPEPGLVGLLALSGAILAIRRSGASSAAPMRNVR